MKMHQVRLVRQPEDKPPGTEAVIYNWVPRKMGVKVGTRLQDRRGRIWTVDESYGIEVEHDAPQLYKISK